MLESDYPFVTGAAAFASGSPDVPDEEEPPEEPGDPPIGFGAVAFLHVQDNAPKVDYSYNHDVAPITYLRTTLEYRMIFDITFNRYVSPSWGYTQVAGPSVGLIDTHQRLVDDLIAVVNYPWTHVSGLPVGSNNPEVYTDSWDVYVAGLPSPEGSSPGLFILPSAGAFTDAHYETGWWRWDGADMFGVDLFVGGQPASGFYGHEQDSRLELEVRSATI